MNKLQETIENTIINNVDVEVSFRDTLKYNSVKTTASDIVEEMKDVAIEFAGYYIMFHKKGTPEQLFEQFINERYK